MKRSVKLIILAAVAVALFGGYKLIGKLTAPKTVEETAGTFPMTEKAAADLSKLEWNGMSFVRSDDGWTYAGDASYPLDSEKVETLAEAFADIQATRKLDNVTNTTDYGLDEPAFEITGEWADGTKSVYQMGAETPFNDGYYLSNGEENTVYIAETDFSDDFDVQLIDLAKLEEIQEIGTAVKVCAGEFAAEYREESATLDETAHWYDTVTGKALKTDTVESLVSDVTTLDWEDVVSANAADEELEEKGLGTTAYVAEVDDADGNTVILLLGGTDENGSVYARLDGSHMVYTVTADLVTDILKASAETMLPDKLIPVEFANLDTAVFTCNGIDQTIVRIEEEAAAENEEDESTETAESTETVVRVTLNGEETDAAAIESLWKTVTGLKLTAADAQPEGDAILTLTVKTVKGAEETFAFYEFNADSYLVVDGGGNAATVSADTVDKIIRTVKNL